MLTSGGIITLTTFRGSALSSGSWTVKLCPSRFTCTSSDDCQSCGRNLRLSSDCVPALSAPRPHQNSSPCCTNTAVRNSCADDNATSRLHSRWGVYSGGSVVTVRLAQLKATAAGPLVTFVSLVTP